MCVLYCIAQIIKKAKEISREHALLLQAEKDTVTGLLCTHVRDPCARLYNERQKLKPGDIPWKSAATSEKCSATDMNHICK